MQYFTGRPYVVADNIDGNQPMWGLWPKRLFDIIISLLVLLVLLPLVLLSILCILVESGFPVIFKQRRVGLLGREFDILKFRTMSLDHCHDPNEIVSLEHQSITTVGRYLRRLKIDELPQLFNVVLGDMALVGPRPTLPEHVVLFTADQRKRLDVRPGCTGLAQVMGNTLLSWEERIQYDLCYISHLHFLLDVRILLATWRVVVFGESRFDDQQLFRLLKRKRRV